MNAVEKIDHQAQSTAVASVTPMSLLQSAVASGNLDLAEKLMGIFSEDDLKEMFGDHIKVKVTAAGAETEEYSHD